MTVWNVPYQVEIQIVSICVLPRADYGFIVALCPSTTSAVLTKYTALKSFQAWVWKMVRDPEWKTFVEQDNFMSRLIYCYEPCHIYAAALFEDLMTYKDI